MGRDASAEEYARPAWVEVDLGAVTANVAALRRLLSRKTEFMAVVKADGYGHGLVEVSRTVLAAGADRLGVALLEEGETLRSEDIDAPLQVLGEMPAEAAVRAVAADLHVTTGRREMLDALAAAGRSLGRPAHVHLKVDTGMRRIGCEPQDALGLARRVLDEDGMVLAGVMTHFATAERAHDEPFRRQLALWEDIRAALHDAGIAPQRWHAANSAATVLSPSTHLDMVRCGIAVYGLHPGDETRERVTLEPALRLLARVSHVKTVRAGEGVSYGHTWLAERDTRIATVPVGYADGYTRRLSNTGYAIASGRVLPVVGNVTMDQILLAVPEDANVDVGDPVTLIGEGVTADDLARLLGTINYEITCMLDRRLPRRYLGSRD